MIKGLFDITVVGGKIAEPQNITTRRHLTASSEPQSFYQGSHYKLDNYPIFDTGIPQNTCNKNIISVIYKPKFFMLSDFLLRHKNAKGLHQAIVCVDTDNKMQVKNHTLYRGWKSGLLRESSLFLFCIIGAVLGFFSLSNMAFNNPVGASLAVTSVFLAILSLELLAKLILFAQAPKFLKRYFILKGLYRGGHIIINMPLQIQSTNYDNPHHIGRIHLFKAHKTRPVTKKHFILSER